jgi:hypothetical protein
MKDIVDLTVTQIRIYPVDALPFADLRLTPRVKAIQEAFHFANVQPDLLGGQLIFSSGTFEGRGKSVNILSLTIDPRRIQIQARARSAAVDAFYNSLIKVLEPTIKEPNAGGIVPLVKAEETSCVAILDIDFDQLIAPALIAFLQGDGKSKLRTQYGEPRSIAFKNLSFEIKYAPASPTLEEHDVVVINKMLTIEPRQSTPLRERRFFTLSPTDSETHVSILEALEKVVAKSKEKVR